MATLCLQFDDNQLQELPDNFLINYTKLGWLKLNDNQLPSEEVQKIRAIIEKLGKKENNNTIKLEPQNKAEKE